mmetsp:Transcript_46649/g.77485  ORF Transcript_46649/g.77485 Transcript_46649/m.77485 type:complete len:172 (+) Transcript_46649:74-589(+)
MTSWAPTVLRWLSGFWCFNTLFFCVMMLIKPELALSALRINKRFFGKEENVHATPNHDQAGLIAGNDKDSNSAEAQVRVKHEKHLQRIVGIQGIARALYGVFAIVSGDDSQIISYCIVNIIVDTMTAVQYYRSQDIVHNFQVWIHVTIIAVFNLLFFVFVCFSLSEYHIHK